MLKWPTQYVLSLCSEMSVKAYFHALVAVSDYCMVLPLMGCIIDNGDVCPSRLGPQVLSRRLKETSTLVKLFSNLLLTSHIWIERGQKSISCWLVRFQIETNSVATSTGKTCTCEIVLCGIFPSAPLKTKLVGFLTAERRMDISASAVNDPMQHIAHHWVDHISWQTFCHRSHRNFFAYWTDKEWIQFGTF